MAKKKADESVKSTDVEAGKACAILAYLLIGIIWFFADEKMRKNKFVGFHVKQGIVLILTSFIGSTVLAALIITIILLPLWQLAMLVLFILGIINVINGKTTPLPVIGGFAKHFNF